MYFSCGKQAVSRYLTMFVYDYTVFVIYVYILLCVNGRKQERTLPISPTGNIVVCSGIQLLEMEKDTQDLLQNNSVCELVSILITDPLDLLRYHSVALLMTALL